MTLHQPAPNSEGHLEPIDGQIDHVRGSAAGHLILEYGDYECPYSREAFHQIERVESRTPRNIRFAFRHFPLTAIHPHALAAPTLFIEGSLYTGRYDADALLEALAA